jgi:hypothetical protein
MVCFRPFGHLSEMPGKTKRPRAWGGLGLGPEREKNKPFSPNAAILEGGKGTFTNKVSLFAGCLSACQWRLAEAAPA